MKILLLDLREVDPKDEKALASAAPRFVLTMARDGRVCSSTYDASRAHSGFTEEDFDNALGYLGVRQIKRVKLAFTD
jgi:hypothetical protein